MNRLLMRLICLVLAALFLTNSIQVTAMATAGADSEKEIVIGVDTEAGKKELRVKQIKGTWFAEVYSLAAIAECTVCFNEGTGLLRVYRPTSQVTLYGASNEDEYTIQGSSIYVPLDKCAQSLGLRFQRYICKDGFYVSQMKTLADLRRTVQTIFNRNCYHLWEVPDDLGLTWGSAEFFARLWAAMPFVGSGSMIGTISGQDEQERYDRAIKSILESSGSFLELIYTWADTDKSLKAIGKKLSAADDMTDTVWGWIDDNDSLCKKLNEAGIYETVREMFRTGSNPYEENIGDFLKGYPTVANAMNINYWLETFAFYGAAVDGDEALLLAMNKVFGNSSNKFLRSSAEKLFDSQFGKGKIAISDIYGGYIKDFLFSQITDELEDALYGREMSLVGKVASMGITDFIEYKFDSPSINGISDAMIYYSIYSTISVELANYYYQHRYDNTEHIGADLRSIALMYLNTARACVDKCKFDSSLDDATTNMDAIIDADVLALLAFAEQEYDPSFLNTELINYLDSLSASSLPHPASPAQASEADKQSALNAYSELLHDGIALQKTRYGGTCTADHYYLFDMNNDGLEEMIAYTSPAPLEWAFAVFTYKDGQVEQIADSVNTCDISEWSNSSITVEISNGILHANAGKATAAYTTGSDNYLLFNGENIYNYRTIDALPVSFGSNAFVLIRTDSDYGVLIGSDQDYLGRIYMQNHPIVASTPQPTLAPSPVPTAPPQKSTDYMTDGEYYGLLTSWTTNEMTIELLNYDGRNEMSFNYMLSPTGIHQTLDISQATIWLEYAWSEDYVETQCDSIDAALSTEVWGGVTLREACTMKISFTVSNSQVTKIVFLYAA